MNKPTPELHGNGQEKRERTRLVLINHGLATGGTDSFIINTVSALDPNQFDITIALAIDEDNPQFREEEALALGAKIIKISDLDGTKSLRYITRLLSTLKNTGPYDAIHSNMDMFNGVNLFIARLAGIPVRISHAHTSGSQFVAGGRSRLAHRLYAGLMKASIRMNATAKIGCSDLACHYLYGQKTPPRVIFNGIPLDKFRHPAGVTEAFQASLGVKPGQLKFVTVGRFSKEKNSLFMVDIINEIAKRDSRIHLTWVGSGDLKEEVQKSIARYGIQDHLTLLEPRKDIPEVLNSCEYFLFPSLFEGLPIALIEAQAAGLECFVSDTITRLVDCGTCQYIPLNQSASQWAEAILNHINNNKKMALDKAKLQAFSTEEMARQLIKIYKQAT